MRTRYHFLMLAGALAGAGIAYAGNESSLEIVAELNRTSIIMNGIIRIVAIAAGAYIVWLGHNTLIRGVKGEFEFEGQFGKLKGSTPGLLFVLLGSLAIGWALRTPATGDFYAEMPQEERQTAAEDSPAPGSSISPAEVDKGGKRPSDARPGFLNPSGKKRDNG